MPNSDVMRSNPTLKVEAGILGRWLWPLRLEDSLAAEYIEHTTKVFLRASAYCELFLSQSQVVAQRLSDVFHCLQGCVYLCTDAAAWESQHTAEALGQNAISWAQRASMLRPAASDDVKFAAESYSRSCGNIDILQNGEVYAPLNGSLLSADPLTQAQNSTEMETALSSAAVSIAKECGCIIDVSLTGKGDDAKARLHSIAAGAVMAAGVDR
eukprot:494912-Amphidinium_carterae.1